MKPIEYTPGMQLPEEGIILNYPQELYHMHEALSSSMLKEVLRTPLHYYKKYILKEPQEQTPQLIFGNLMHKALLEPKDFNARKLVMPDFGDKRTKMAKEAQQLWQAQNYRPDAIILNEDDAKKITGMLQRIQDHSVISNLFKDGVAEVTVFWIDPVHNVKCRCRGDYYLQKDFFLLDYKSTKSAQPKYFMNDAEHFHYDLQVMHYKRGFEKVGMEVKEIGIVAQEKEEPYLLKPYRCNEIFQERGDKKRNFAIKKIKECVMKGAWPGYSEEFYELTAPMWTQYEDEQYE